MKKMVLFLALIGSFLSILLFPQVTFEGASNGLLLWYRSIIPTLFPFVVLSNLFIRTNGAAFLSRFIGPVITRIFGVSNEGSFAILTGFLCGYPMGAKTTADLVCASYISKKEGAYLLSFCNNTSPMFMISYVLLQQIGRKDIVLPSLCILIASPILCSFFFRPFYRLRKDVASLSKEKSLSFRFSYVDGAIMDGFETITKVGGYIILFSVLLNFFSILPWKHIFLVSVLFPSVEITGGIAFILKHIFSFETLYVPIMALTSFGGWCSIAQTKSMIAKANLPIFPYIIEKLITALVTSLLSFCYLQFILT